MKYRKIPKESDESNLTEKRVMGLYKLIKCRGELKRFEIQESTGWQDGIYERTMAKVIQKHPDIYYDKVSHSIKIRQKEHADPQTLRESNEPANLITLARKIKKQKMELLA